MVAVIPSVQSLGMYRITEAARYLATGSYMSPGHVIGRRRLTSWIRAEKAGPHHFHEEGGPRYVTFLDLICMRIIALLRSRGMTLASIHAADRWLQDYLNIERPFASQPLWTSDGDLFTVLEHSLISPSKLGQGAFDFVGAWISKVELDMTFDNRKLAASWHPHENVCLSPAVQMGQPCVTDTRIPTSVILAKIRSGETLEAIGSLYELDSDKVRSAIDWEERVGAT